MKVLLDTNFCLLTLKNGWALEELIGEELIIPDFIIKEIIKVEPKNSGEIIQQLMNNGAEIKETNAQGDNDEELLKLAVKTGSAIATNDSELRKKALKKGVQTLYLRQGKKVVKG